MKQVRCQAGNCYANNFSSPKQAIGCFVAGTLVHTREGLRAIEQIKVGDYVLSKREDGNGETAYKRVVNTFEFEDKETWFISWEDTALLKRLRSDVTAEEFLEAHGNSFVVTTPNHPFWVVESDEEYLRWYESPTYIGPPFPQQQWVRADHIAPGMTLLLADGRVVDVVQSKRVYTMDRELLGWVDLQGDGSTGLAISFESQKVQPNVAMHAWRFTPSMYIYEGLIENPNESYANDCPPGNAPYSWYRSKVYNLEVEDFHTYFVDTMGVWVHNTNSAEVRWVVCCPRGKWCAE